MDSSTRDVLQQVIQSKKEETTIAKEEEEEEEEEEGRDWHIRRIMAESAVQVETQHNDDEEEEEEEKAPVGDTTTTTTGMDSDTRSILQNLIQDNRRNNSNDKDTVDSTSGHQNVIAEKTGLAALAAAAAATTTSTSDALDPFKPKSTLLEEQDDTTQEMPLLNNNNNDDDDDNTSLLRNETSVDQQEEDYDDDEESHDAMAAKIETTIAEMDSLLEQQSANYNDDDMRGDDKQDTNLLPKHNHNDHDDDDDEEEEEEEQELYDVDSFRSLEGSTAEAMLDEDGWNDAANDNDDDVADADYASHDKADAEANAMDEQFHFTMDHSEFSIAKDVDNASANVEATLQELDQQILSKEEEEEDVEEEEDTDEMAHLLSQPETMAANEIDSVEQTGQTTVLSLQPDEKTTTTADTAVVETKEDDPSTTSQPDAKTNTSDFVEIEEEIYIQTEYNNSSPESKSGMLRTTPKPPRHSPLSSMLSPFSPVLKSRQRESVLSKLDDLSFVPCRKVSTMVRVLPHAESEETDVCVFPILHRHHYQQQERRSSIQETMQQAHLQQTRSLVVVNPSAMGLHISSDMTMETARLVAEVAKIETEDWLRKYSFDHVEWPSLTTPSSLILEELAHAIANDVQVGGSHRVCFGMGSQKSDQTETLLGKLLGLVYLALPSRDEVVCTLSVLEIVDDDTLEDWLDPSVSDQLRMRHPDMKGAVVQNLTKVHLDGPQVLEHWLQHVLSIAKSKKQGHGHILATLKIYGSTHDRDMDKKATVVQFVDLASGENFSKAQKQSKQVISVRQSLSALRGILRNLLQQEATRDYGGVISYRECALTKLLQRSLEPTASRVVLVGSVSALRGTYDRTLHIVNFMHRLFIGIGTTAVSPFDKRLHEPIDAEDVKEERALLRSIAHNPSFLGTVVSDPRQRLARLMPKTSPRTKPTNSKPTKPAEKAHVPTNYMDMDPDDYFLSPHKAKPKGTTDKPSPKDDKPSPKDEQKEKARRKTTTPTRPEKPVDGGWNLDTSLHGDALPNNKETSPSGGQTKQEPRATGWPATPNPGSTPKSKGALDGWSEPSPVNVSGQSSSKLYDPNADESLLDGGGEPVEIDGDLLASVEDWLQGEQANKPRPDPKLWGFQPQDEGVPGTVEFRERNREELRSTTPDDEALLKSWLAEAGSDDQDEVSPLKESPPPRDTPASRKRLKIHTRETHTREESFHSDNMTSHSSNSVYGYELPKSFLTPRQESAANETGTPSSAALRSALAKAQTRSFADDDNGSPSTKKALESQATPKDDDKDDAQVDKFMEDIHDLQGAVDGMKTVQIGLWQSSATALDRVQHYLHSQQNMLKKTVTDRRELQAALKAAKESYETRLRALRTQMEAMGKEKLSLEKVVRESQASQANLERVADEAIGANEKLENEVVAVRAELAMTQQSSEQLMEENNRMASSRERLYAELKDLMDKNTKLSLAESESLIAISELQASLQQLQGERDRLAELRSRDHEEIKQGKLVSARVIDLQNKLKISSGETSRLQSNNQDLQAEIASLRSQLALLAEAKEEESYKAKAEISSLQGEIMSFQCRLREAEESGLAQQHLLEQEVAHLDAKIKQLSYDRDQMQMQQANDQAELDTLRMQLEGSNDTAARLKTANGELMRLRKDRADLQSQVDDLHAATLSVEEKDAEVDKLKIALQTARSQFTSYQRRVEDAEAEMERLSRENESEKSRLMNKLSAASQEMSRMRTEMMDLNMLKDDSATEVARTKLAVKAREDEVKRLRDQLKESNGQMEELQRRHDALRDGVTKFREEAKGQVTNMYQQKKETDQRLEEAQEEIERHQHENSALRMALQKLERQNLEKQTEVGELKGLLDPLSQAKGSAEAETAKLSNLLIQKTEEVEALRHQMEVARFTSEGELTAKFTNDKRAIMAENAKLGIKLQETEEERDDLQERLRGAQDELADLQRAKSKHRSQVLQLESSVKESNSSIEELRQELEAARLRSEKLFASQKQAREKLANKETLASQLELLQLERDEFRAQVEQLRKRLSTTQDQKATVEAEARDLQSRLVTGTSTDELLSIQQQYRDQLRENVRLADQVKSLHDQLHEAQHKSNQQIQALRQEILSSESSVADLESKLQQSELKAEGLRQGSSQFSSSRVYTEAELLILREIEQEKTRRESMKYSTASSSSTDYLAVQRLEEENRSLRQRLARGGGGGSLEGHVPLDVFREERAARARAEELVAAVAARSKGALEARNIKIQRLKASLTRVTEEKEAEIRTLRNRLQDWERGSVVQDFERISYIEDTYESEIWSASGRRTTG